MHLEATQSEVNKQQHRHQALELYPKLADVEQHTDGFNRVSDLDDKPFYLPRLFHVGCIEVDFVRGLDQIFTTDV